MLVLVGTEKCKFGFGIQERAKRNLFKIRTGSLPLEVETNPVAANKRNDITDVVSVLVNPTSLDSLSPTVQLQLVLGYGPTLKDQLPLGNYLWFSDSPPVKILTRPKNPVSAEGEKPAGESSIIGAF